MVSRTYCGLEVIIHAQFGDGQSPRGLKPLQRSGPGGRTTAAQPFTAGIPGDAIRSRGGARLGVYDGNTAIQLSAFSETERKTVGKTTVPSFIRVVLALAGQSCFALSIPVTSRPWGSPSTP